MGEHPAAGARDGPAADSDFRESVSLLDLAVPLIEQWKLLIFGSLALGLLALGAGFLATPIFTARTSFLPQQQQSSVATALASLGGLAALAGAGAAVKTPADQLVGLMRSATVQDRLVERFKLIDLYEAKYRFQARALLDENTRITVGKKDGLVSVEVDDESPQRAADIANAYVDELRRVTSVLAVSEAQQRRMFFEKELADARDEMIKAQQALQATGFNLGALRAEPKAAAEGYARLKAELTGAEVRLRVMRNTRADTAPEVQRLLAEVGELRTQLARVEQAGDSPVGPNYVTKFREYKYRETLFELFARQYEVARVDESREGPLIQVLDVATPPEWKSKPKRLFNAVLFTLLSFMLLALFILVRHFLPGWAADPARADQIGRLRTVFGRR